MQFWLFALAGAVAPAPAQVLAASPSNATATTASAAEATAATPAVPTKPTQVDPPVSKTTAKKPLVLDPPATAFAAPKKPVVLDPPTRTGPVRKGALLAGPSPIPTTVEAPSESNAKDAGSPIPTTVDTPAPVVLSATEQAGSPIPTTVEAPTGANAKDAGSPIPTTVDTPAPVQLAVQEPESGQHEIHDMIHEAHKAMCEDGRMDSVHCEKFRSTLDDMHKQIEQMHDEHQSNMAEAEEEAPAEAAAPAEEAAPAATATSEVVTTEVESVEAHEPVITKHKYPYKTGPCASGATVVALLFSGLLFA